MSKCDRCSTTTRVMAVRFPGQRMAQELCLECHTKVSREMAEKKLLTPQ